MSLVAFAHATPSGYHNFPGSDPLNFAFVFGLLSWVDVISVCIGFSNGPSDWPMSKRDF